MYNRPTNNETNIIRDIFSNSLKESFILSEAKGKGKGREKGREKGAERSSSKPDPLSQTEKTIEDALKQAEAEAPGVATPTTPDAGLGELGTQPREINTAERFTDSAGVERDVIRDPSTGQVIRTQESPTGPAFRIVSDEGGRRKERKDKGTKRDRPPTEKELNWREGGGTDPVTGERITGELRDKTAMKIAAGTMGGIMAAGTIGGMVTSGLEDDQTTTKPVKRTPTIPGSKPQVDKQLKTPSNAMKELMDTIKSITSGTLTPDTTKSTGMPGGLAPPPAMPPVGGNAPAKLPEQPMDAAVAQHRNAPAVQPKAEPAAKPEQYFETPPEPDQTVYNYSGTLVGAPKTPEQTGTEIVSKSTAPQTPNIPEYKGGMKGESGEQTGKFGASGLPPRSDDAFGARSVPGPTPERKLMADAIVTNEKGEEVRRLIYKNPETGKFETEDTPTRKVSRGIPGEPRFGAYPPAGPPGGYAGQGLRDWGTNVLPPSSENPYLKQTPRPNSLSETYYNLLSQRLDEEKSEPSGPQVNQAAYGYTARGGRNARKALASLQSGMWRGDSTSSGNIRAQTRTGRIDSNLQPSWGEKLKPHVITLMSAAQDHKIELSKEEAVNPGSKDHQRLLSMYPKDHDVHKASQAVGEIMRSRSNA